MQCASCRFENIPGLDQCGRCGSPLRLDSLPVDVHPPRATTLQKRLRRLLPWRRVGAATRDAARDLGIQARPIVDAAQVNVPSWDVLWRLLVPGLAQFHVGAREAGWLVVALYVPLLLLSLLFYGTEFGAVLLGLAFALHAGADLALLLRQTTFWPARLLVGALVFLALGGLVYGPATWAAGIVAMPMTVSRSGPPFAEGDVLLNNPRAYRNSDPAPGDIVRVRMHRIQVQPGQVLAGDAVDRVLAKPGSLVEWNNRRLLVDGVETKWRPLNPERLPEKFVVKVPADRYFIYPSTLPYQVLVAEPAVWQPMSLVLRDDILGTVYWQMHRLSKFGPLR